MRCFNIVCVRAASCTTYLIPSSRADNLMMRSKTVSLSQLPQGQSLYLAKRWWILLPVSALFLGGFSFVSWLITWPAIRAAQLGQAPPAGWSWTSIIAFNCLFACIAVAGYWEPWVQLRTVFTEEDVSRPRLFGRTVMTWSSITHVGVIAALNGVKVIELRSREQSIKINPLCYKRQDKLLAAIREHAPASALM